MKKLASTIAAATALLALPMSANAIVFQFNAALTGAQQNPPITSSATGVATLFYNDMNTVATADDSYSFSMVASGGLSFNPVAYHLHQGAVGVNGGIQVNLAAAPFISIFSGGTLLVGGNNITSPSPTLLSNLKAGLEYVNIHTGANPGGEIRGQLIQVAAIPEPATYAMFGLGLGLMGMFARRRAGRPH